MEHFHKVNHHKNTQTVLNDLRQRYLIKRNRSTLNRVIRKCQTCVVQRAKPVYPQMASHPADRLAIGQRAFTNVGVDCFGPITTTVGRRKEKRWGMLFTCLTTRAVHLEMAYSLSGESCIKCIQNFTNRRGPPKTIRSDNGTNFVYAATQYRNRVTGPKWRFIPPAAPHQGGAWERLVGSVKRALTQMQMPDRVTDEEFTNFLSQAEALINARPLTEIPNHPHGTALTPNHFILGSAQGDTDDKGSHEANDTEAAYHRILMGQQERQGLVNIFWDRWKKEYLPTIAARPKWKRKTEPLTRGDLVFICETTGWIRGRVEETFEDPESGQVREAIIKTASRSYRRPATKIAKIRTGDPNETRKDNDAQDEHH